MASSGDPAAAAAAAAAALEINTLDDILELNILREEAKAELLEILESLRGRKCLVIDVQLRGLFSQIISEGSKFLKENGVQYLRELYGDLHDFVSDSGRDTPENIVYLVRPNISSMKLIAHQVKGTIRSGIKSQIHICFVPSQSTVCLHLLEDQINNREVWDKITFGEFRLGLIPFDTDVLSLEMDSVFKQCYVDGDLSSLNTVAMGLLKLQSLFGVIPNIKSKGLGSKKVLQKMFRMRVEEEGSSSASSTAGSSASSGTSSSNSNSSTDVLRSKIDTMVILDREIDLVSPLVTPLTYEGLVDNMFGIRNGRIRVDQSVIGDEKADPLAGAAASSAAGGAAAAAAANKATKTVVDKDGKVSIVLNNNDAVFAEIRNLSVEKLGAFLQTKAINIHERYTAFKGNKDASISEIHDFVKKIPKLTKEFKSLNQHINIAELIKTKTDGRPFREQWEFERGMLEGESYLDNIEDLLCADTSRTDMYRILQLLCIQSLTAGGIRASRYDALRKGIAQTYGYQHMFTLSNLERSGLLRRNDNLLGSGSVWNSLRKAMKLIDASAGGLSYVSAGYAPLLARLVQQLASAQCNMTWNSLTDVLKLLPGPALEVTQLATVAEELSEAVVRSTEEMQQAAALAAMDGNTGYGGGGVAAVGSAMRGMGSAFAAEGTSLLNYTQNIMNSSSSGTASAIDTVTDSASGSAVGLNNNNNNSAVAAAAAAAAAANDYNTHSSSSTTGSSSAAAAAASASAGNPFTDLSTNPFANDDIQPEKKVMLVFVVGGITYLEMAAFRHLSQEPSFPFKIIMATTKIMNGENFLESLEHSPST